ncbi:MAG: hypothetical protein LEGION0398_MBIBDBAK_01349 [Legionellaceae bacterium]
MATKLPKEDSSSLFDKKEYFLKPHESEYLEKNIHELEALSSEIYRFLLGNNRAPKVRVLLDENDKVWGTVSKKIGNYKSFYDVLKEKNKRIPNKKLIEAGFGSLMAASYIMEENDLHGGNYGFNDEGKLCRIDFDQNLLPLFSSAYLKQRPSVDTLNALLSRKLDKGNYPLKEAYNFQNDSTGLVEMEKNEEFCIDKWKTFVKLCLLTKENINAMLQPHVKQGFNLSLYSDYIYKRAQAIKEELLKSEDFRMTFLRHSQNIISSIKKEVNDYNQQFKDKYSDRKIPINEIELNNLFQKVYSETLKQQSLSAKEATKERGR